MAVNLVAEDGSWINREEYDAQVIAGFLAGGGGQGNGEGLAL